MSRHAFGSKANIDTALAAGTIGVHDVLLLDEGEIGWINKNGEKVLVETKKIMFVEALPETGEDKTMYVYNNQCYFWNGTEYVTPNGSGVSETVVDEKINVAKTEVIESANTYTDEQIANAISVVEF